MGSREFLWDDLQTPPTQSCQCRQVTGLSLNAPQLASSSCWMPLARANPLPESIGIPAANPCWGVPRGSPPTQGDACPQGSWGGPLCGPAAPHVLPLPRGFPVLLEGPDGFTQQPHGGQRLLSTRVHEALPREGGGGIWGKCLVRGRWGWHPRSLATSPSLGSFPVTATFPL